MAADAALQDTLVAALLTSCLPYLAVKFGEAAAAGLPPSSHRMVQALCILSQIVQKPWLAAAVVRHMCAPGAAATLRHAASVVAATTALPADVPAGLANHELAKGKGCQLVRGLHQLAATPAARGALLSGAAVRMGGGSTGQPAAAAGAGAA